MQVEHQTFIIVAQKAEVFSVDEICNKLEKVRVSLERLNQGKEVPPTFARIALSDLKQALFLLEGAKEYGKNFKKA